MRPDKSCKDCLFYDTDPEATEPFDGIQRGLCRAVPPGAGNGTFPTVQEDDWCGNLTVQQKKPDSNIALVPPGTTLKETTR